MAQLEDLKQGAQVRGIHPSGPVTVIDVRWFGSDCVELTFKDGQGRPDTQLLYRGSEPDLEVVEAGTPWAFDSPGDLFRLVAEARRIRLAYLFDPLLAVHTSLVEPLPHQITAVYEAMLPRQPLRFLLADDPGAGKTIMAGLLIKELVARGDVHRCMVVAPGMLVEQWQDELWEKFRLPFEILTNDQLEAARSGNWFTEHDLVICRLDKLARDEDVQAKIRATDWDLIVCDEAHKMSATFFGTEAKYTKRYRLGRQLSEVTRHFLLMTATPHNGKEEDFQLFMALLDGDRFEGRFRDGVHTVDVSDLMRRLVKEQLIRFDGTPLFPERRAYTVTYPLSDLEAALYERVTNYVREEFNRADAIENEGRKGTVGFALMALQRRLASSPEAIYQSLRRRRERLESRLDEAKLLKRGAAVSLESQPQLPSFTEEEIDDFEDAPDAEREVEEERIVDEATAARTIEELQAEIRILTGLEELAQKVRRSGTDRKWDELRKLLLDAKEMFDQQGHRRKLVIFSEHKDTLKYLIEKIRTLLGREEAVVTIHGGMGREERRRAQEQFTQDREVTVLVATDAAGEGINLQRAHLMVNYDIPWNPNRLEQRFGRIHRIGQVEVCHLWNLVAEKTREGDVFTKLLRKLETEKERLGGAVFDVLGRTIEARELRELLKEAIRYGDRPDVRARLEQKLDAATDTEHLKELIEERALARDSMDSRRVQRIREEMERAEARKLQPHFIEQFFVEAFQRLGGTIRPREPGRYEITHVPAPVRSRDRVIGTREPVLNRYERITFKKGLIHLQGKPQAAFVCPGHPLLDAVIDLVLERHQELLRRGTILVDPQDPGEDIRALYFLEHSIRDARTTRSGERRAVSRQLQFVEIDAKGQTASAGYAPYLDYEPADEEVLRLVKPELENQDWLRRDLESQALSHAAQNLVPGHLEEVKARRDEYVEKTKRAVQERLTKEINYWDHRANELREQEQAGKQPKMNWMRAQERADELQRRLQSRLDELDKEKQVSPSPPVVIGGALVVPQGLLRKLSGKSAPPDEATAEDRRRIEHIAMKTVMDVERSLGYAPRDVSEQKLGYDIESLHPKTRKLRFIEVKGRTKGATTVTVTKNEILTALNKPEEFILALVEVEGAASAAVYVREAFDREPGFATTSVNLNIGELLARAEPPTQ